MNSFNDVSDFAKQLIINRLGIKDDITDDMTLDIDKYTKIYFEELEYFDSKEEYDDFLKEKVNAVNNDVVHKIAAACIIINTSGMKLTESKPIDKHCIIEGKAYLRIFLTDALYDGLKYLTEALYPLPESAYDYIISITESKFLSSGAKITEFITDKGARSILFRDALKTVHLINAFLCPLYLNPNQLVFLNNEEIIFRMTKNITLEHITSIYDKLINNGLINLNGFGIQLLEVTEMNEDGTVKSVNQII